MTGGYFADPGRKDVAGLARLGFPIAEVAADGRATITKVAGSGGAVTVATCTEQLLYEIRRPRRLRDARRGRRLLRRPPRRGRRRPRPRHAAPAGGRAPDTLKVALGYRDGFIGEGQISYAGGRRRGAGAGWPARSSRSGCD